MLLFLAVVELDTKATPRNQHQKCVFIQQFSRPSSCRRGLSAHGEQRDPPEFLSAVSLQRVRNPLWCPSCCVSIIIMLCVSSKTRYFSLVAWIYFVDNFDDVWEEDSAGSDEDDERIDGVDDGGFELEGELDVLDSVARDAFRSRSSLVVPAFHLRRQGDMRINRLHICSSTCCSSTWMESTR